MGKLIGRNTRVEVSKTLGADIPVTAISLADPGVYTFTGAGPAGNGSVLITDPDIEGMLEMAQQVVRVASLSSSPKTFAAESVDTSGFGALTATTAVNEVTAWSTLGYARNVNQGGASANTIDATVLLDRIKTKLMGQSDVPEIQVSGISNPLSESSIIIKKAALANSFLVFRITLSDGSKRVFGGYVSLPSENIPLGELLTSDFSIVQVGQRLEFAS